MKPHPDKDKRDKQRKKIGVKFQVKLVVGCWEAIPLELAVDNLVEEDT